MNERELSALEGAKNSLELSQKYPAVARFLWRYKLELFADAMVVGLAVLSPGELLNPDKSLPLWVAIAISFVVAKTLDGYSTFKVAELAEKNGLEVFELNQHMSARLRKEEVTSARPLVADSLLLLGGIVFPPAGIIGSLATLGIATHNLRLCRRIESGLLPRRN